MSLSIADSGHTTSMFPGMFPQYLLSRGYSGVTEMKTSRKEAIAAKESYYFTGLPCLKNHVSKRQTRDGSCYECRIENQRIIRQSIKEWGHQ